jgi:outer membrane lipoprotein-sorting protein
MRVWAALVVGGLLATTGVAAADARTEAVTRLQARYEATRSMRATFRQRVESPTLAAPLESHGTVLFERPNRMRWDYAAPDEQLIVGDGKTLWIYQPDLKQAIRAPLRDAFQAQTPLTFLAGLGRVERDFDASLEREDAQNWVLRLVPRVRPLYSRVPSVRPRSLTTIRWGMPISSMSANLTPGLVFLSRSSSKTSKPAALSWL